MSEIENRMIVEKGMIRMVGIPSHGARLLTQMLTQPEKENTE